MRGQKYGKGGNYGGKQCADAMANFEFQISNGLYLGMIASTCSLQLEAYSFPLTLATFISSTIKLTAHSSQLKASCSLQLSP